MIGPLSIDLFAPSLPAIADAFATSAEMSQLTISIFMLGFAISMLIVGPLSERFGYRRTLLIGYSIYLVTVVIILVTPSIEIFIAARLIQAICGCFGTALSRVIARDFYRGEHDVRILGMIGAAMMIAPMVAPGIGGLLQEQWGWHAGFILMLVLTGLAIMLVLLLPEQRRDHPENHMRAMINSFFALMTDRHYMIPALTSSLAFSGAFVFIIGAPFVLIDSFAMSPGHYGMIFGLVMGAYILSSACAGRVNSALGSQKTITLAWLLLIAGVAIIFVSAVTSHGLSVNGLLIGLAIYEIGLGLFLPSIQARALAHLTHNAGTGAGMIFFLEMAVASTVSYISAHLVLTNTIPLASIALALVILALVLYRFLDHHKVFTPK